MAWVNCTSQEVCTYSQALVEGFLPTSCSDTNVSAQSKSITIASKSWANGTKIGRFPGFRFGMMLNRSMENHGAGRSTSWQRDSHASHTAQRDQCGAKMTKEICGLIPSESYARWDRESACWKTYQLSLLTNTSEPFSGSYPKAGMMRDGKLYRRLSWERPIGEIASGFLPTPKKMDGALKGNRRRIFKQPGSNTYMIRGKSSGIVGGASLTDIAQNLWGGAINPAFSEWLMMWPMGWISLKPLAMDNSQSAPQSPFSYWLEISMGMLEAFKKGRAQ